MVGKAFGNASRICPSDKANETNTGLSRRVFSASFIPRPDGSRYEFNCLGCGHANSNGLAAGILAAANLRTGSRVRAPVPRQREIG